MRLAEVFDVTTDFLLLEDAPRRPGAPPTKQPSATTGSQPSPNSNAEDLALVASFIDALVTKTKLKVLACGS